MSMNILILGVTGMLGNAMFRHFAADQTYNVYGTARNENAKSYLLTECLLRNNFLNYVFIVPRLL